MSLATPIALGTIWGLIFSGITVILLITRTALEDAPLKEERDFKFQRLMELRNRF
jgi:hypothetical protein